MAIKRIDPKLVTQIERWLSEWATGQYGERLSWQKLAVYSGFSRQSLSANRPVSNAYRDAKVAIRRGFVRRAEMSASAEDAARIEGLLSRIAELEERAVNWASLWERWRYNARQQGWDLTLLDQEMPKPSHRRRPRH
jgi:hypothetical protein